MFGRMRQSSSTYKPTSTCDTRTKGFAASVVFAGFAVTVNWFAEGTPCKVAMYAATEGNINVPLNPPVELFPSVEPRPKFQKMLGVLPQIIVLKFVWVGFVVNHPATVPASDERQRNFDRGRV